MGRVALPARRLPVQLGWWGVVGFCVLALAAFTHLSQGQLRELEALAARHQELVAHRDQLLQRNQELRKQIQSQHDPEWIEQRLMSRLGVIPKGTRKVVFVQPISSSP
jgi:hypothetical protein